MLRVLAPDEGETPAGRQAWQVKIEGGLDPEMASEGVCFAGPGANFFTLATSLRRVLHANVSSTLVDETWSSVARQLRGLYEQFSDETGPTTLGELEAGHEGLFDLFSAVPLINRSRGTDDETAVCMAIMAVVWYVPDSPGEEGDLWTLLRKPVRMPPFYIRSEQRWDPSALSAAINGELERMRG